VGGRTQSDSTSRGVPKSPEEQRTELIVAARRLVAGEASTSICRDLNKRGIRTRSLARWDPRRLDAALKAPLSPLPPGLRQEVLTRIVPKRQSPNRTYLLTGILLCGGCGDQLVARRDQNGKRRYLCRNRQRVMTSGHVAIAAAALETWVSEEVLAYLEATFDAPSLLIAGAGEELREHWATLALERRVAIIKSVVTIQIGPPTIPGAPRFNAERVSLFWR